MLDSNQLISSLLSRRSLQHVLIDHWREGAFLLFLAPGQLQEVVEVLDRPKIKEKYRITPENRDGLLRLLDQDAILLPDQVAPRVCRDPDDDYLLGCAAGGRVHYLVTGDADLLTLKRYETVVILTAREFLAVLRR